MRDFQDEAMIMGDYQINYHTGAGNLLLKNVSLKEAMDKADEGISFTQQNVTIIDNDTGYICAERKWVGARYDVDIFSKPIEDWYEEEIIQFGNEGYYEPWDIYVGE